jgi:hypothetical protein
MAGCSQVHFRVSVRPCPFLTAALGQMSVSVAIRFLMCVTQTVAVFPHGLWAGDHACDMLSPKLGTYTRLSLSTDP